MAELCLASKFGNIKGTYVQLDDDFEGYPAYINAEVGTYLYHVKEDNEWAISKGGMGATNSRTCFVISDSKDVTGIQASKWEQSGSVDEIFVPTRPDTNDCSEEVVVETPFKNTSGCYYRMAVDFDFYPAYHCSLLGTYLYHVRAQRTWFFSKELAVGSANFNFCESDDINVTALAPEQWKFPDKIVRIIQVGRPDTSNAPRQVGFVTPYSNFTGAFLRMERDFDYYPAYHCSEQNLYLYHNRDTSTWFVKDKLEFNTAKGENSFFCRSEEVDVTKMGIDTWNNAKDITRIWTMEAPNTANAPSMVLVTSKKFKNVGGVFRRLPEDFEKYPAYHSEEKGLYLFHERLNNAWWFKNELSAKGRFMNMCQNAEEIDPTKLAVSKWDDTELFDSIEEFVIVDASLAPRNIAVNAVKEDLSGCYEILTEVFETYPAYQCKGTGTFLFHNLDQQSWNFGRKLGDGFIIKANSASVDVTKLVPQMWSEPEVIKEIFETRVIDQDAVPKQVVIVSKLDKMGGCFERREEDFEGYPTYYNKEQDVYIFHVRAQRTWHMATEINAAKESLSSCTFDEADVTRTPASMWSTAFVRIFSLSELSNRKVTMFHGATMKEAKTIGTDGFKTSAGDFGTAVYLLDENSIEKAKQDAHDSRGRANDDKAGVALIECEVDLGEVFVTHEKCPDGKWATEGISACWSSKADAAHSNKWAIADSAKIKVVAVSDLRNVTERSAKRHLKYADAKIIKKAIALVASDGGYPAES
jgi:hypothetical protein